MAMEIAIPAYDGNENYIFVSYAHNDAQTAYPFIKALQENYNVWYDNGIHYGNEWEEEIAKRLKNCSLFIFLVSKNSLDSENCKDELYHARKIRKNFINILTNKDVKLPDWFDLRYGRFQMCDLSSFASPKSAIESLEKRCEWFVPVKKDTSKTEANVRINNIIELKTKPEQKPTREFKKKENQTGSSKYITFGNYKKKEDGSPEPIEWVVLSRKKNKMLIVSKYALDCRPFDPSLESVDWENCSLRKWLNGSFLNEAFSYEEQRRICRTILVENKNPSYSTGSTNTKTDNIFLLSSSEAIQYFGSPNNRKCSPTNYAMSKGAMISNSHKADGRPCGLWWLRSPGKLGSNTAAYIYFDGSISEVGSFVNNVKCCVRPALWIFLES